MKDKDKIERLQAIAYEKYESIDLDRLAVFSVGELAQLSADLSFENAVVACFKLFPKKFSLSGYSNYPDSDRIRNCLNRCTRASKKWLGGKALHGFQITERSHSIIQEARELLSGEKQKSGKAYSQTRRKESLILELKNSPAYLKFIKEEPETITEADMCVTLQGTLDSSRQLLHDNLRSLKTFAEELEDKEAVIFLNWLGSRFEQST